MNTATGTGRRLVDTRLRRPDRDGVLLWAFAVVAAVELVAVATDVLAVQWLAKPLLAPLLLAWLWRVRAANAPIAVGLLLATAGDVALLMPSDAAFLVGMGCFLGTQLALVTAFVGHRRARPAALAGYLALWVVANALLWPRLGELRLPVLGYSLALCLMAATATALGLRVALGGALFLFSDLLIGLGAAGTTVPGHSVLVMATYSAALFLISTGWAAASRHRP
ncbi:lysoplasmalogenase [Verrucosispora sp. WMMD703]|uniref:lysoplasmalogenase n=1 Tax=unclassified Micromonospora TaxID=2617518 RepID=UPI00249AF045|nr:lysoplasmalogenase [Verrucosispora sp. WMMD1129]WFE42803.1 lysoplasmalogenase [Verrucosispora sp. WMMD1129]WFE48403.1 lysoplasmalogenase [Verrucosispora sp. WMMD1129]